MLRVLRDHQRIIFAFVAVGVGISMIFFGVNRGMRGSSGADEVMVTLKDGEEVRRSEWELVRRFLSREAQDGNILNDGVISEDFLRNGVGLELAKASWNLVEPDIQKRLERERNWQPYKHPSLPHLNAESLWGFLAPGLLKAWKNYTQTRLENNMNAFEVRADLYLQQQVLSDEAFKKIVRYQESRYGGTMEDDELNEKPINCFGYKNLDDWFGPNFLDMVTELVLHTAKAAEDEGLEVDAEIARADLSDRVRAYLEKSGVGGWHEQKMQYQAMLARLGMDEEEAVSIWQKILAFRRYYQQTGQNVVMDLASARTFGAYANEAAVMDVYSLDEDLRINNIYDFATFEIYLETIAAAQYNPQLLPTHFKSVEQVKQERPELVHKHFKARVGKVNKQDYEAKIPLKEVWQWQLAQENWPLLQKEFPELGLQKGTNEKERIAAIETLDALVRLRLDRFTRDQIFSADKDWLEMALAEALEAAPFQEFSLSYAKTGKAKNAPLPGITAQDKLTNLLSQAAEGKDPVFLYTQDDNFYYRFDRIQVASEDKVFTFAEAKANHCLEDILEEQLKNHYDKLKASGSSRVKRDGLWLTFDEAKTEVLLDMMTSRVEVWYKVAQEASPVESFGERLAGMRELRSQRVADSLVQWRFYKYLLEAKKNLMQGKEDYVRNMHLNNYHGANQWKLNKTRQVTYHAENKFAVGTSPFDMDPKSWSKIMMKPGTPVGFFYLDTRLNSEFAAELGTDHSRRLLATKANEIVMRDYIHQLKKEGYLKGAPHAAR